MSHTKAGCYRVKPRLRLISSPRPRELAGSACVGVRYWLAAASFPAEGREQGETEFGFGTDRLMARSGGEVRMRDRSSGVTPRLEGCATMAFDVDAWFFRSAWKDVRAQAHGACYPTLRLAHVPRAYTRYACRDLPIPLAYSPGHWARIVHGYLPR